MMITTLWHTMAIMPYSIHSLHNPFLINDKKVRLPSESINEHLNSLKTHPHSLYYILGFCTALLGSLWW